MKLGFIGAGNMAEMIIKGLTEKNVVRRNDIYVYDINQDRINKISKTYNTKICTSEIDIIESTEAVVLATKPNVTSSLLPSLNGAIEANKPVLISIAAGKTIEHIESLIGVIVPIIRVMPNINAKTGTSVTAFCCNEMVSLQQKSSVYELFSAVGSVYDITEKLFDVFSVVASSGPAFLFLFAECLIDATLREGMERELALDIVYKMIAGSTKTLQETGEHSSVLIDQVCSPGGCSIEALISLNKHGFENSIYEAVRSAVKKVSVQSK